MKCNPDAASRSSLSIALAVLSVPSSKKELCSYFAATMGCARSCAKGGCQHCC